MFENFEFFLNVENKVQLWCQIEAPLGSVCSSESRGLIVLVGYSQGPSVQTGVSQGPSGQLGVSDGPSLQWRAVWSQCAGMSLGVPVCKYESLGLSV